MLTEAEVEKLQEEHENYKKALKEERSKRRDAEAKVEELKENHDKQIKELKKATTDLESQMAQKTDEVGQRDSEIQKLNDQLKDHAAKSTKYEEHVNKTLEAAKAKIPQEKQEFVNKALQGKSLEEQLELAEGFAAEYSKKDFKVTPNGQGNDAPANSDYEKAKQENNIMGMIKNAPVVDVQPPTT